ncbi:hypothetical protein [Enterobacter cloacae]|uniref:hypothetical protein n=1 Tax=Enterobacter cloacae TaxID=550 RepID=UPI002A433BEE|nr:hypothetical protein [Enterobacter cloacae]
MRRCDLIISSLLNEYDGFDYALLLMLVHYTFNVTYPYEGFGIWDEEISNYSANEYKQKIKPAEISKIDTYIKELWDVK